jgi:hypothetical protein
MCGLFETGSVWCTAQPVIVATWLGLSYSSKAWDFLHPLFPFAMALGPGPTTLRDPNFGTASNFSIRNNLYLFPQKPYPQKYIYFAGK